MKVGVWAQSLSKSAGLKIQYVPEDSRLYIICQVFALSLVNQMVGFWGAWPKIDLEFWGKRDRGLQDGVSRILSNQNDWSFSPFSMCGH